MTHYHGDRGGRGVRGHQCCGGRGGHRGRGSGKVRGNDDWEITGLNGRTITVNTYYRFENDQWCIILEDTRLQLEHMRGDYHICNHQHTDAGSRKKLPMSTVK